MAEFLTAVHWLRVLVAQFRWHPCIDNGILRQVRGLDKANRAAAIAPRRREGCGGCCYYVATHGACHVQPPVQQRGDNHPWPSVQPNDWCGAFSSAFGDEA
jgi:hypothetical protein